MMRFISNLRRKCMWLSKRRVCSLVRWTKKQGGLSSSRRHLSASPACKMFPQKHPPTNIYTRHQNIQKLLLIMENFTTHSLSFLSLSQYSLKLVHIFIPKATITADLNCYCQSVTCCRFKWRKLRQCVTVTKKCRHTLQQATLPL